MSVPPILDPLLPVLALSALGFALSWLKSLPQHWDQMLAEVAAKILLPCLLFEGASRSGLSRGAGGGSLLAFYGPVLVLFGAVAWLAHRCRWRCISDSSTSPAAAWPRAGA